MKSQLILILFAFLLPHPIAGQDLRYAQEVVKTLASPEFKGRGYVAQGDKTAAAYIKSQFEEIGLLPFGKSYFQKFTTPVNTFPSKMKLSVNEVELTPGEDYLIDAGSPGLKGTYETIALGIDDILNSQQLAEKLQNSKNKFVVVPAYDKAAYSQEQQKQITDIINFLKFSRQSPASGTIILTHDKLTWDASTTLNSKPSFTVVADRVPKEMGHITVEADNKFLLQYKTQNILGYLEGENQDSLVVLMAHYDHLGMMGSQTIFPGANDNASGVAMLLNLAKYYQAHPPKHKTVFIAFGGEELGLLGAQYFVEHPLFKLSKIKFLLNFDISGTGEDGIQVVNGSVYKDKFDLLTAINQEEDLLKKVKIRGEACNSDHCMFYRKGVPGFFIYTLGGIQAYHDINDKAATLPLTEFEDYFKLITLFLNRI